MRLTRGTARPHESFLVGIDNGLDAVAAAELGQHAANMTLDRRFTQVELLEISRLDKPWAQSVVVPARSPKVTLHISA